MTTTFDPVALARELDDIGSGVSSFNIKSRSFTDQTVARIYKLGMSYLASEAGRTELAIQYDQRQIRPKAEANHWLYIVRAATGQFQPNLPSVGFKAHTGQKLVGLTKFKPSRHMERYAAALRYMEEESVALDGVQAKIDRTEGRLDGLNSEDRERHPAATRTKSVKPDAVTVGLDLSDYRDRGDVTVQLAWEFKTETWVMKRVIESEVA